MRGFYMIGVWHPKTGINIGTLWRHANLYQASQVFTIGRRYPKQSSDTLSTPKHIPCVEYVDVEDLVEHLPWSCPLIAVEMASNAKSLGINFSHPERACYLLGAEDHGLPPKILAKCHGLVSIPCPTPQSMNVAVAGTLVIWDRFIKGQKQ